MGNCQCRSKRGRVSPGDEMVSFSLPDFKDPFDPEFCRLSVSPEPQFILVKPLTNRKRFKHLQIDLGAIA